MAMRRVIFSPIYKPTRVYLLVTEPTKQGPSEVDRYVISDDTSFSDVSLAFDDRGICYFNLLEDYKYAYDEDIEDSTIIEYLQGKGLRITDTEGGEHDLVFDKGAVKYELCHRSEKPQNGRLYRLIKPPNHYSMSLLYVMSNTSEHDNRFEKKKLEIVLPTAKIRPGAFPRGKMVRTFETTLLNWLTGKQTLKLSVCLPDTKAERQKSIKFILYIREETDVRIKGFRVELLEELYTKELTHPPTIDKEFWSIFKIVTPINAVRKYEMTFTVPNSLEYGCQAPDEAHYQTRDYSFRLHVRLPFPHEDISYKIPLQADCDPMK